jgi:hypothetical protein
VVAPFHAVKVGYFGGFVDWLIGGLGKSLGASCAKELKESI